MIKLFTRMAGILAVLLVSVSVLYAQNTVVSGSIKDNLTGENLVGVSISIKGRSAGTATNENGRFTLTTSERLPFTLVVTYVGYKTIEQEVTSAAQSLNFALEQQSILGQEVVISASRTPERILESPVSIERISAATIRENAAPSFYDALVNLKGVEVSTQSLTFKSINTRGFNSNGNVRFNQYVDGMDNQAPGLNFSVGNIIGLSDLDVDNVELLPGASSALYGAGGINGTMLMRSKSPFDYQGLSFQVKTGINHVNDPLQGSSSVEDVSMRYAKAWNRFAFKVNASYLQADDWQAANYDNFDRIARTYKSGNRSTDPNYDGINSYGDEVNQNLRLVNGSVEAATRAGILNASGGAFNPQTVLNNLPVGTPYASYVAFINANVPAALRPTVLNQYLPFYYAQRTPGVLPNETVSRTGYAENALVDYDAESFKASGSLHYKLSGNVEAIASANYGSGTSVYTGSDRYSLRNFNIGQYKLELKGSNFFLRGYTTQERSGDSYIASILGSYINETSKPSTTWFPQYLGNFIGAKVAGQNDVAAHGFARNAADQGRFEPGSANFATAKDKIMNTTISSGLGAKFDDKSNLYHYEGLYNFSSLLNNVVEFQAGASYRNYDLNSNGTIFDDLSREIDISEVGVYGQLGKKFADKFKLTLSGRYDKNENFDGRFTPRLTGVYTVAPNNNIRVSYQTGYRNPTTQNQYIDLSVGGGSTRLIGGLPEMIQKYNLYNNKPYTDVSYRAYLGSIAAGAPNPTLLKTYSFDAGGVKPESVQAYELGYKGLLGTNVLIDAYGYYNKYKDFITAVDVYQANGSAFTKFGVPVNAEGEVTSYGAALGLDYIIGKYNLSGNVSYNEIGDIPTTYINDFNTPTVRFNLGVGNKEIAKNIGFNVVYRWQGDYYWNSSFASGDVPAFGTVDAQVNLKMPVVKSILKVGASNLLNKYYITSYGNPQVGGLYYVSLLFDQFLR